MVQLLTIARNTFVESIRQPIYVVLILAAAITLVLLPQTSAYTLDDDNQLLIQMGISTLYLTGILLAAFTATGVVSEEIEQKTVLTVISKPVARPLFILGKFLGVLAAIALAMWALGLGLFMSLRHGVMMTASDKVDWPVVVFALLATMLPLLYAAVTNYLYQWVFPSTLAVGLVIAITIASALLHVIAPDFSFQSPLAEWRREGATQGGQLAYALILTFAAIAFLTAVAVAVSTRLGLVMTLVTCVVVFGLGLTSDSLFLPYIEQSATANILYHIIPNLQFLWPGDALAQGNDITTGYLGMTLAYSTLLTLAALCLAVTLFQTREVG